MERGGELAGRGRIKTQECKKESSSFRESGSEDRGLERIMRISGMLCGTGARLVWDVRV